MIKIIYSGNTRTEESRTIIDEMIKRLNLERFKDIAFSVFKDQNNDVRVGYINYFGILDNENVIIYDKINDVFIECL